MPDEGVGDSEKMQAAYRCDNPETHQERIGKIEPKF
jgi:hypothetical protein